MVLRTVAAVPVLRMAYKAWRWASPPRPPGRHRSESAARRIIDIAKTTGKPADAAIFISYRRDDDPGFAGRLYDKLATTFGAENVFIDVDAIELGLDFTEVINRSLSQCKALIAVIGKEWLNAVDDKGVRRLNKPDDFVRREIETALARDIRVIPVLVNGAHMPEVSELPQGLASLANRHAFAMSHAKFGNDGSELIWNLTKIIKSGRSEGKAEPVPRRPSKNGGN